MSTETVSQHKWHLALSIFLITIIAGIAVVILLALGAANPPRAGELVWQADTAHGWPLLPYSGQFDLHIARISLPQSPFTLEIIASNEGTPASAWGLWLRTSDGIQSFLVSNEGYMSISNDENAHWAQFIHVRAATNKLYLHVQDDQAATFRINDEIAWQGTIMPLADWGIVLYGGPDITWQSMRLYAER